MSNVDLWLRYITAEGIVIAQSRVKGNWGVQMDQRDGSYFHFLAQGTAYYVMGDGVPTQMQPGDLIVFPQGASHQLKHCADSRVTSLPQFVRESEILRSEDSDATVVLCGQFGIDRHMVMPAIKALPSALHLRADAAIDSPIRDTLRQLRSELESARLGSKIIIRHLLSTLFIYILREWSENSPAESGNWFCAMQNNRIAKALAGIHQDPGASWTLTSLAQQAGLSRAAFARHFRESVGETPHSYLTRWRLGIAAQLLAQTNLSITEIADKVGYQSEYSFNRAFKLARGITPAKERDANDASKKPSPALIT
jgi:AraC-like DNA-binding protein